MKIIEYQPCRSQSRRLRRRVLLLAVALVIAGVGYAFWEQAVDCFLASRDQWLCEHSTDLNGEPVVVYGLSDGERTSYLAKEWKGNPPRPFACGNMGSPVITLGGGRTAPYAERLLDSVGRWPYTRVATLFSGKLRSETGNPRLVIVNVVYWYGDPHLQSVILHPAFLGQPMLLREESGVRLNIDAEPFVRGRRDRGIAVWAGKNDPVKADTFRAKAQLGGRDCEFVGRLTPDDRMEVDLLGPRDAQ